MGIDLPDWKPGMPRAMQPVPMRAILTAEACALITVMRPEDALAWIEQGRNLLAAAANSAEEVGSPRTPQGPV